MTTYAAVGEKLDRKSHRSAIAHHLAGQTRTIRIGRSVNGAGFANSTPIEIVEGDAAPVLVGQPFLSTTYRNGAFTKNLYTPSTLRVIVGRNWKW